MANTYHQVYVQAVFAVKFRASQLQDDFRDVITNNIGDYLVEEKCKPIITNGIADHLHCFLGLHPTVPISDLMRKIKAKSSKFINDRNLTPHRFEWQKGFGVFFCTDNPKFPKCINT